jgi:enolase
MKIKKVIAKQVLDSRKEPTIQVIIKTGFFKRFKTSAPEGKSKGEYEAKSYAKDLEGDISFINSTNIQELNNIINKSGEKISSVEAFSILEDIEELVKNQIGANSLFALEASLLKMLAYENNKELYEFLGTGKKLPRPVGNAIGGGLHSKGINDKSPDFQEFLFIGNSKTIKECVEVNNLAYNLSGKHLESKKRNDEGAWETDKTNEEILDVMNQIQQELKQKKKNIVIGLDVAASSFYKNMIYDYKNPPQTPNRTQQINYIKELINKYGIYYLEDPLEDNDFSGFSNLIGRGCFIVGDDLTTTNPERLKKAIKMRSINAIIVKPNQIGSLIKTKQVIDLAKENNIFTIMSHRSGETTDNTIADLAVAWGCDFIKTGIYGKVRTAKLKRLIKIEKKLKNKIVLP